MLKSCATCIALLFLLLSTVVLGKSVTLMCPQPGNIDIKKQVYDDFWRDYEYSATIKVPGLLAFGEQLYMWGQGANATKPFGSMTTATWTDNVFLCWYVGDHGEEVLTTQVDLFNTFSHCAFPAPPGRSHDECFASTPDACPLVCDLKT